MDLRQIKVSEDDFGLMAYDPAFTNTASCRSAITYIDGEAGVLQHRGIPIEQLCEQSTYLEVAYLLVFGELPTQAQLEPGSTTSPTTPSSTRTSRSSSTGFRYDAHPMGMLLASVGRALDLLPRRQEARRPRGALHGDDPADRQDADARRLRLPPQHGAALRLSGQRPQLLRRTSSRCCSR